MIYNYFIMLQFNRYDYIYDVYIGEKVWNINWELTEELQKKAKHFEGG